MMPNDKHSYSNEPFRPMVSVQFTLVQIKPGYIVISLRINETRMVTKPRLNLEAFNRRACSFRRSINTDELNVLLSSGKDVHVLKNKDGLHCVNILAQPQPPERAQPKPVTTKYPWRSRCQVGGCWGAFFTEA